MIIFIPWRVFFLTSNSLSYNFGVRVDFALETLKISVFAPLRAGVRPAPTTSLG